MNSHRIALPALTAVLLALPVRSAESAEVKASAKPLAKASARSRTPAEHLVLPFIEDDYPRALQLARQRKLPIFIDSWAPW